MTIINSFKADVAFWGAPVVYYKGGFVYFGGMIDSGRSENRIQRLDAVTHSWSLLGYLKSKLFFILLNLKHFIKVKRTGHNAIEVREEILIVGGSGQIDIDSERCTFAKGIKTERKFLLILS